MRRSRRARNPLGRALRPRPRDKLFHLRQNAADDDIDTFGARVQPITLRQTEIGGDTVEEERIEERAVSGGQLRIDGLE
jgi:hypothetical protein